MNASPDARSAFQAAFAARIRDPRSQPSPAGVPVRGMRIYEQLLFNNLEGFLLVCFPITRKLLGVRAWRKTVRKYFVEHRCRSPLFRDIPAEFLAWMEMEAARLFPDRPYLYEFMHYEWLELYVSTHPEEVDAVSVESGADLLAGIPLINPTGQLACYHYPVHRIGPGFRPNGSGAQLYCYLVYRDHQDTVRFIELNPVSARLLELLGPGQMTGHAAMTRIADELNHQHPEAVIEMGHALLENLRLSGAVLGVRRST